MQVTPPIFDHIAKLAKLEFNDSEKSSLLDEMQKMVNYVEKLNEIDTTGVQPTTHMSTIQQVPRKDMAQNGNSTAEALQNAPKHDGIYFLVPKVIENPNK